MSEEFSVLRTWPAPRPLYVAVADALVEAHQRRRRAAPSVKHIFSRLPEEKREKVKILVTRALLDDIS